MIGVTEPSKKVVLMPSGIVHRTIVGDETLGSVDLDVEYIFNTRIKDPKDFVLRYFPRSLRQLVIVRES